MNLTLKNTIKALVVAGAFLSTHANAALTTDISGDFVYSSASNVNWTTDGNLFASMVASDSNFISNLIATYGSNNYGPLNRKVTTDDFFATGQVKWEAAMAFVDYLNDTEYAGISTWRLPSVDLGDFSGSQASGSVLRNGVTPGDEFAELYYDEFEGPFANQAGFDTEYNAVFSNVAYASYWTSEISTISSGSSFDFKNALGGVYGSTAQSQPRYVWAVSTVAAIPEPETYAMFLAGLGLLGFAARKRNI